MHHNIYIIIIRLWGILSVTFHSKRIIGSISHLEYHTSEGNHVLWNVTYWVSCSGWSGGAQWQQQVLHKIVTTLILGVGGALWGPRRWVYLDFRFFTHWSLGREGDYAMHKWCLCIYGIQWSLQCSLQAWGGGRWLMLIKCIFRSLRSFSNNLTFSNSEDFGHPWSDYHFLIVLRQRRWLRRWLRWKKLDLSWKEKPGMAHLPSCKSKI